MANGLAGVSGIYAIVHRDSGKLYIGSAVNIARRWNEHVKVLKKNRHHSIRLQRAWNKHGKDAFAFVILQFRPAAELVSTEQRWLDETQAAGRHGYNICQTAGSQLGMKRTDETRARIGNAHRGRRQSVEWIAKKAAAQKGKKQPTSAISRTVAAHLGRKRSAETCVNISASLKGVRHSPERRARNSESHRGKRLSPETIAKRTASRKANRLARMSMVQGKLFT